MSPTPSDQPDGTEPDLGAEARKLLGAVQEWARRALPAPPGGHPGPECQWCPLCQFASVLRGEHPELAERVTEAGAALVNAFQALAETAATRASSANGPARRPKPRPGPRVQHIDLTGGADGPDSSAGGGGGSGDDDPSRRP